MRCLELCECRCVNVCLCMHACVCECVCVRMYRNLDNRGMLCGGTKLEHLDLFEGRKFVQNVFALAQAQLTQQPLPLHRQH